MFKITLTDKNSVIIDPSSGKRVIDGKLIKNLNSFWRNRIKDGDITIQDMSKKQKTKKDN